MSDCKHVLHPTTFTVIEPFKTPGTKTVKYVSFCIKCKSLFLTQGEVNTVAGGADGKTTPESDNKGSD